MIGFLNVYKPTGMSSAAVVGKIKKQFNLKKVGHMGTLDPLACGILPIAIGKATRMFDYFLNKQKTYVVEAEFGYETSSLDLGTEIINTTNNIPSLEYVKECCKKFVGKIDQIPPIFSAKCVNGERAYDLARKGQNFELKAVKVEVFKFECLNNVGNKFKFEITCSSGTYVRSLIRDLAYKLNSYATVTLLERVDSGYFNKESSIKLDDLLNLECLGNNIIKITDVFNFYKQISVNDFEFCKLKNGISISKNLDDEENVFIMYNSILLGVAEIKDKNIVLKTYLLND